MRRNNIARFEYRWAKTNANSMYFRIERLKQVLHFEGFGDREPEIVVTESPDEHNIGLWWNDVLYDMETIIEAEETEGRITPSILETLLLNM